MVLKLSAQHLAEQDGGYEPQRANNGQLFIFELEGWNSPLGYVSLSVESFDLPEIDMGAVEMHWMGQRRKVVGNVNFSDLEIVVRDFVDKATSYLIWQWIAQVHNSSNLGFFADFMSVLNTPLQAIFGHSAPPTGGRGLAKNYKKTGLAVLVAPDGSHHRAYYLQGIWPKRFTHGKIDHESEEILKGNLTLAIDTAEFLGGVTTVADLVQNPEQIAGLI